jgi:hypothetical protein
MKDEVPIGDVVYEKDGYAIHKIDGEEHKVWHCIINLSSQASKLTLSSPAICTKPFAICETLPRHQVRLLRRLLFSVLPLGAATTRLFITTKQWRINITSKPSSRILQQREDELGQQ